MKYCVDAQSKRYFEQHHFVVLHELLSQKEVLALTDLVKPFLKQSEKRDCALVSNRLQEFFSLPTMIGAAQGLLHQKRLRYGVDWLFSGKHVPWKKEDDFSSLSSLLSVRPIVVAALLALTDAKSEPVEVENRLTLPHHAGDALFFDPNELFSWSRIPLPKEDQTFLLIAYAGDNALYTMNPEDSWTNELKQYGYGFGDRLREATHPTYTRAG